MARPLPCRKLDGGYEECRSAKNFGKEYEKMSTAKNVTVIPATLNIYTKAPMDAPVKRKVAGYARVSTGSEEQATN